MSSVQVQPLRVPLPLYHRMKRYVGSFFTKSSGGTKRTRKEGPPDKQNECATPSSQNKPTVEGPPDLYVPDPGKRLPIMRFAKSSQEREMIRRIYLTNGPCQPKLDNFPQSLIGGKMRRFNPQWYNEFGTWLEYSESKDVVFCLHCYLFKCEHGDGRAGHDSFTGEGFSNWKDKQRLFKHIGKVRSIHNLCFSAAKDLMNQNQHIDIVVSGISDKAKQDYRIRLNGSIRCIRYLIRQGLAFRGHNETDASMNQGNFVELVKFLCESNEEVNYVSLNNAPENLIMIAPSIQKDITIVAASLVTRAIISDIGDNFFSILVDEARDISIKEQMAIVLRYVNCIGDIIERFLGLVHVSDTTASSLKETIEISFAKNGLSLTKIRGQGYDGASNMSGQFSGLKSLILVENNSAYYVHCFAHQLQLALVACAKKVYALTHFFNFIPLLCNAAGASCKRADILREKQFDEIVKSIASGDVQSGRGLNQEMSLSRPGDTRWSSHYRSLVSLCTLFDPVLDVLEIIKDDTTLMQAKRSEASGLIMRMQTFEFVLLLNLMIKVLAITNELSQTLQRKDQDIVNAMTLVKVSKVLLQNMRDNGWDNLFKKTSDFCIKHDIDIPDMESVLALQGRTKRRGPVTHLHHFKVDIFYAVIDTQLQELDDRFSEVSSNLLECMACLNPCNSFSAFDKNKLCEFAGYYPSDFDLNDFVMLEYQLDTYIFDMQSDPDFLNLQGIADLAKRMLALTLPVATASVERAFSAMKYIKTALRNRIGDEWLNDCLVPYIEKDVFDSIDNEAIMMEFQKIKPRRMTL
ncbi:uncharacterized protein LOC133311724 [Gastrolobium bilobum]|uniref:uncharacterized protein LOC133311724 n=1 Tax=Gastrolobium bilobum TaxID=150636 RepID=UPI002AB2FC59|nr:uncharacterized protein LOC133311724 [Gastrolobium bilobum]